ncbi:MAG: TolC family protein [Oligoflexales bacterium]
MLGRVIYILYFLILGLTDTSLSKTISLEEFIEQARAKNSAIKVILHELKENDILQDLTLESSPTNISIRGQYGIDPKDESKVSSLRTQLEKPSPETGRNYSIEFNKNGSLERKEEILKTQLNQSILKNSFGSQYSIRESQVKLEQEEARLQVIEAYEDIVQDFMIHYLDWQLASLSLQASKDQSRRFKKIVSNIKARFSQSIAHPLDVKQAEYQLLLRKENVLNLEGKYRAFTAKIQTLLESSANIKPSKKVSINLKPIILKKDQIYQIVDNTRKLAIMKILEKINSHNIDIAKEQYKPDLAIFLGYEHKRSTLSSEPTDKGEAYLGMSFNYPLGDTQKNALIKTAVLGQTKILFERLSAKEKYVSALSEMKETINSEVKMVNLQSKKWDLAKEIMKKETNRYEQGEIELQPLIDAESRLADSQYAFLKHQVYLVKKRIEWMNLADRLVLKLPGQTEQLNR